MARKDRIAEIAEERGTSPDDLMRDLLNRYGDPERVAHDLDVHINTVHYWMRKLGARRRTRVFYEFAEVDHA